MLRVRILPSLQLAVALGLVHVGAAACVLAYTPGKWLAAAVAALIGTSLVWHVRREALQRARDAVIEIVLNEEGRCELLRRDGGTVEGIVHGSTFVSAVLIVMNVRAVTTGKTRSVTLMPDSAPADDLRQLRVWLRYRSRRARSDSL